MDPVQNLPEEVEEEELEEEEALQAFGAGRGGEGR